MADQRPVILFAPFRSSGTYVWNLLREQPGLCGFYEPFNELLWQRSVSDSELFAQMHHTVTEPYFNEYPDIDEWFKEDFCYQQAVLRQEATSPQAEAYLQHLIASTGKRPVFKCCRAAHRGAWLKKATSGLAITVVRPARDQWMSWLSFPHGYFDAVSLLTAALHRHSQVFAPLDQDLALPLLPAPSLHESILIYQDLIQGLSPENRYELFFYTYLSELLASLEIADVVLDLEAVSHSSKAASLVAQNLSKEDLSIDFSDCRLKPYETYTPDPKVLDQIEHRVADRILIAFPDAATRLSRWLEDPTTPIGPEFERAYTLLVQASQALRPNPHFFDEAWLATWHSQKKQLATLQLESTQRKEYALNLERENARAQAYIQTLSSELEKKNSFSERLKAKLQGMVDRR